MVFNHRRMRGLSKSSDEKDLVQCLQQSDRHFASVYLTILFICIWIAFYLFAMLFKYFVTLYLLTKGGFSPLLCPLVFCHSPLPPQAVLNLSLYATHTFVFLYSLYYSIIHLVRDSQYFLNSWDPTMKQIDLVKEHIIGRNKVFIIIFSNI